MGKVEQINPKQSKGPATDFLLKKEDFIVNVIFKILGLLIILLAMQKNPIECSVIFSRSQMRFNFHSDSVGIMPGRTPVNMTP